MTESTEPRTEPLTAEEEARLRREFAEAWSGGYRFAATNAEVAGLLATLDAARQSKPSRVLHAAWCRKGHGPNVTCNLAMGGRVPLDADRPEGPDRPEWVDLAADIRAIDGNHDTGAGSLAAALTARGWTRRSTRSEDGPGTEPSRERRTGRRDRHPTKLFRSGSHRNAALRSTRSEDGPGTLDPWTTDLTDAEQGQLAEALRRADYRNWSADEVAAAIAGTVRAIAARRLSDPTSSEASDG